MIDSCADHVIKVDCPTIALRAYACLAGIPTCVCACVNYRKLNTTTPMDAYNPG